MSVPSSDWGSLSSFKMLILKFVTATEMKKCGIPSWVHTIEIHAFVNLRRCNHNPTKDFTVNFLNLNFLCLTRLLFDWNSKFSSVCFSVHMLYVYAFSFSLAFLIPIIFFLFLFYFFVVILFPDILMYTITVTYLHKFWFC